MLLLWPAGLFFTYLTTVNGCIKPAPGVPQVLEQTALALMFAPWIALPLVFVNSLNIGGRAAPRLSAGLALGVGFAVLLLGPSCAAGYVNGWFLNEPRCL